MARSVETPSPAPRPRAYPAPHERHIAYLAVSVCRHADGSYYGRAVKMDPASGRYTVELVTQGQWTSSSEYAHAQELLSAAQEVLLDASDQLGLW